MPSVKGKPIKKVKCHVCEKPYANKQTLQTHLLKIHEKNGKYSEQIDEAIKIVLEELNSENEIM